MATYSGGNGSGIRAAIYCRVSTDGQRDNYSIPTQLAECLRYVHSRGWGLVGTQFVNPEDGRDCGAGNGAVRAFVDDYTSRELSRPSLDAALLCLETTGYDVLVVHALDRLARDPYIRQTLENEFTKRGAYVEFVLGNYEASPEGEVRKDLDATFGKWENAKRVERCNRGKMGKAQKGKFVCGRAPFGYRYDEQAFGGLTPREDEAPTVQRIFRMYLHEGQSIRGIAESLTAEGVPADGGKGWAKSSVTKVLRNTTYAGKFYYNKWRRVGRRLILRDAAEWVEIPCTAIVDTFTFRETQKQLDTNREARRQEPSRFYLLTGMVFCEDCGRPYATQTAKGGKRKRPNDVSSYRHRVKEGHCINRQISGRLLESAAWADMEAVLMNPEILRKGYSDSLAQQEAMQARNRAHLETLQRNKIKYEQKRRNLNSVYIDPDTQMSKTEYLEQKADIDGELRTIAAEIERIQQELAAVPVPADLATLETFMAEVRDELAKGELTPEVKRQVLEALHVKVLISLEGKSRIEGWFYRDRQSSTTC